MTAAGQSLTAAQDTLTEGTGVSARMGLSEAELEVKAAVEQTADGVVMRTLTAGEIARGTVQPAAVSTVRVRFVAVATDDAAPAGDEAAAIDHVRGDPDLRRLGEILGGLTFSAAFAAGAERWVVRASDAEGRLVREVLVADPPPKRRG